MRQKVTRKMINKCANSRGWHLLARADHGHTRTGEPANLPNSVEGESDSRDTLFGSSPSSSASFRCQTHGLALPHSRKNCENLPVRIQVFAQRQLRTSELRNHFLQTKGRGGAEEEEDEEEEEEECVHTDARGELLAD